MSAVIFAIVILAPLDSDIIKFPSAVDAVIPEIPAALISTIMSAAIATFIPKAAAPAAYVVKLTVSPLIDAEKGGNPPTSPYAVPIATVSDVITFGADNASAVTL